MNRTRKLTTRPSDVARRRRAALAVAVSAALAVTACGGSDGSGADDADIEIPGDAPATNDDGVGDLDSGQEDLLDDVLDDVLDEVVSDDEPTLAGVDAWSGIRLVSGRSSIVVETLDGEAFSGVVEAFDTSIPDPIGTLEYGSRVLDNSVVVGETLWVSATTALHRVELADGTISATIPAGDVLAAGEFGDITGDANGIYAVATAADADGTDLIVEVDPTAATVRSTIDVTDPTTPLLSIASSATHVAAAYRDAPGTPVKLIQRASGATADIGSYTALHEVHFVRDELWVVSASGSVSDPATYERFDVNGTKLSDGVFPRPGTLRVFDDRAVLVEPTNDVDPSNPVGPVEIEPQGAPIEDFLPDGLVSLTAYAELDGFAVSAGDCCLQDEGGFPLRAAVVDMATGEVVHTADSISATAILPAG